ncbi:MAG: sigma-54-dependent Fis family transcriptional regulator [Aromatoleum sp.]|jgi:DNA-binding NtrC family response regulator|uniref:sigma-54-dependent Fis family transcriptional regulator n=1 Tax=Aromatoleum sp. TaxID=2307007 RepID=UPI002895954B|nr:sigma-54-dependent Fis family transcriptional regulator [Aromatoleum sp.]MDT3672546.1 sigma-54-dependent Fis family transcriptional regulator [Aromatoleum sp.]
MTKLQEKLRVEGDDLRARVHFCADTGQIWLHEHRMLLVHAEAQASLRKELIDTLGMARARGLLLRMGYASGVRDAELVRTRMQDLSDAEAFMTGPQLHALEGIVRVVPVRLEVDRAAGDFYAELIWENSWEGHSHRRHFGIHDEPVCWTQIGYACGYTSAFMGRSILYKEVECAGMGHGNCRIVGKPIEDWPDADEHMRYFTPDSIADQLIDLQTQVVQLRSSIGEKDKLPADMLGASPGFRAALALLKQAAAGQITVLLLGETGVGKELFARALHDMSARRDKPLVAINCAAIPHELVESELFGVEKGAYTGALVSRPGRFERADGGTLFLDEIGDLPLTAQSKLLRVLQEGEVERLGDDKTRKINVRLVAATNAGLPQLVKEGRFRADLYYRLNAFQIDIPPLRERREDVSLLAKHFLAKYAAINGKTLPGFTDRAKRALTTYPWPGNIRELQNTVERGVILAPQGARVEVEHLFLARGDEDEHEFGLDRDGKLDDRGPDAGKAFCESVCDGTMTLDEVESMLLETAMDKARGNLSSAARMLGLTRPQLAYRLKRLSESAGSAAAEAGGGGR